jgi:hypothetical protein
MAVVRIPFHYSHLCSLIATYTLLLENYSPPLKTNHIEFYRLDGAHLPFDPRDFCFNPSAGAWDKIGCFQPLKFLGANVVNLP